MGMSVTIILSLSHHCVLETDNFLFRFHRSTEGEELSPGWIIPRMLSIYDSDDLNAEIWNFRGDMFWWHFGFGVFFCFFVCLFFPFIFISWRLITLQYCSGFCQTLTRISHGFTCYPHPDPPSCLPPHPIPLGLPSAPAPSTCLMHPSWAGDLFHPW